MVKTLIKIAIALIVIHGAVRVGSAFWNYYRFEDALLQIAQFGDRRTERQLCDEAMSTAADYDLPLAAADLTVRRGANPPFNCQDGTTPLRTGEKRDRAGPAHDRGDVRGPPAAAAGLLLSVGVQTERVGSAAVLARRARTAEHVRRRRGRS